VASKVSKKILSVVQYLFFLFLGLGLLWLSFREIDTKNVYKEILHADYYWLLVSIVVTIISHLFRAARWNLLIGAMNYKTRLRTTFFSLMTGYMVNIAVPRLGEVVRCGVLSKKENIPFNVLFGTVISERFFDLIVLLTLIFLVIVFQLKLLGEFLHKFFGPFLNMVFSNIWPILWLSVGFLAIGIFTYLYLKSNKRKFKNKPFYHKIHDFVKGVLEGVKTIKNMKRKGLFLLYTFFIWLFYSLMVYTAFFMLKQTSVLNFVGALTILAIGSLGIVAPVPGGIGAYHFIVMKALSEIYSIKASYALSYATITHGGQTLLNIVVGAVGYAYLIMFSKNLKPVNGQLRNYTEKNPES
jgi:uncharacterized protein (TIRG00374 family)